MWYDDQRYQLLKKEGKGREETVGWFGIRLFGRRLGISFLAKKNNKSITEQKQ